MKCKKVSNLKLFFNAHSSSSLQWFKLEEKKKRTKFVTSVASRLEKSLSWKLFTQKYIIKLDTMNFRSFFFGHVSDRKEMLETLFIRYFPPSEILIQFVQHSNPSILCHWRSCDLGTELAQLTLIFIYQHRISFAIKKSIKMKWIIQFYKRRIRNAVFFFELDMFIWNCSLLKKSRIKSTKKKHEHFHTIKSRQKVQLFFGSYSEKVLYMFYHNNIYII